MINSSSNPLGYTMKTITKNCENCSKTFQASAREINRGNGRFCSLKCSANRIRSNSRSLKEHNCSCSLPECGKSFYRTIAKIKNAKATGLQFCSKVCKDKAHRIGGSIQPKHYGSRGPRTCYKKQCELCNKDFETTKLKGRFCSGVCASNHKNKIARQFRSEFRNYRLDSSFRFGINEYPNKFDFDLIKKYGWYSASNRGNNVNGIARDHMFSVYDGFHNKIDPKIVGHPANCRLMQQRDNSSKNKRSSITLEDLLERIKNW